MYNYIYKDQPRYIQAATTIELIRYSTREDFRAFEWESIPNPNGPGLSTKLRMISVTNGVITPTQPWRI